MSSAAPAAFISYCRDDSDFALRLAQDLKAAGAPVWLDQLDIQPGHPWDNAIEDALLASPRMLLVLSPASVRSHNVRNEISFALEQGKIILPVFYQDCIVPLQLHRIQRIDFRTDYARGLASLLAHLHIKQPTFAIAKNAAETDAQQQVDRLALEAEARRHLEFETRLRQQDAQIEQVELVARKAEELRQQQEAAALAAQKERQEQEDRRQQAEAEEADRLLRAEVLRQREEADRVRRMEEEGAARQALHEAAQKQAEQAKEQADRLSREAEQGGRAKPNDRSRKRPGDLAQAGPPEESEKDTSEPQSTPVLPASHTADEPEVQQPSLLGTTSGDLPAAEMKKGRTVFSRLPFRAKVGFGIAACCVLVLLFYFSYHRKKGAPGREIASSPSSYNSDLFSLQFPTPQVGWIVGDGVVFHTTDSGETWKRQGPPDLKGRAHLSFISPDVGWLVTDEGDLRHTEDGGATWVRLGSPPGLTEHSVNSIAFTSPHRGWVVASKGVVLHTEDGGVSWTNQMSGTTLELMAVTFVTDSSGWIVTAPGDINREPSLVLHTKDGGTTWKKDSLGDITYAISFIKPNEGWIIGYSLGGDFLVHTRDGGLTWTGQTLPSFDTIESLSFLSPKLGWCAGHATIQHTKDGGVTWRKQFVDVAGEHSEFRGIVFTSPQTGWVAGYRSFDDHRPSISLLLRTQDGGETWEKQSLPGT